MKIMCGGKDKNLPLPTANRHQLVSPDFLLQRILVFCHTAGTCGKSGMCVTFLLKLIALPSSLAIFQIRARKYLVISFLLTTMEFEEVTDCSFPYFCCSKQGQ